MTDILHRLMDLINQNEVHFMTWGPPGVLLILALLFSYTAIRNVLKELSLYLEIRKLGVETLRNIVVSDGMDGKVMIENVVLAPGGIYVLPIKRYCGIIFAADNMNTWTQVVGKRSYKFPNPLPELETYIMAIRNLLPDVNVSGCILVTQDAEFPKGKPERVIPVNEAVNLFDNPKGELPPQLKTAWENLNAAAMKLTDIEKRSMRQLDDNPGYISQYVISIVLVCAAVVWIIWRFWYPASS